MAEKPVSAPKIIGPQSVSVAIYQTSTGARLSLAFPFKIRDAALRSGWESGDSIFAFFDENLKIACQAKDLSAVEAYKKIMAGYELPSLPKIKELEETQKQLEIKWRVDREYYRDKIEALEKENLELKKKLKK